MTRSFYEVLGVSEDASREAIENAYRRKVKECHPDVSDDPDADEDFKNLVRTEEVLGDPEERETYDRLGHEAYVRRVEGRDAPGTGSSPWTTGDDGSGSPGSDPFDPREAAAGATGDSRSGGTTARSGASGGSEASSSEGFGPGADRQHATGRSTSSSHGFGPAAQRQQGVYEEGSETHRFHAARERASTDSSGYSVRDWSGDDVERDPSLLDGNLRLVALAVAGAAAYTVFLVVVFRSIVPLVLNLIAAFLLIAAAGFLFLTRLLW